MFRPSWFWDRMAVRYARMPIADPAAYETKLEKTRAYLRPDSRVLEFGCGTGSTALVLAPRVAQVHAIDTSAAMLAIAREKVQAAGIDNLSFEHTTLTDLDSPAGRWDVILGMNVLHLLPNRRDTLARAHALLKPGGVFISSTLCAADAPLGLRLLAPLVRALPLLPRISSLRLEGLTAELVAAGFEIEAQWRPARHKAAFVVARKPGRLDA
ncbi:class I SAM-dependent methyltransferase [Nitrogeniibacter mangrovi]|uniref:class I SAM-dependent methyltransferase n=1 Tax=Nitrogeniibacter mangrovi TaxID=2016596 RepID=UPI001C2DB37F|nr:class I SAM-dependent methyltransferase [Nitrogeniibacter mangrovi]